MQFSKHVISRETTRKIALATLQQWRTRKVSERFWRQVRFYVRYHRVSFQRLMEVPERDSQRLKSGKSVRKKCAFTFLNRFRITRLFKKRGSPENFKYDLIKATKNGKRSRCYQLVMNSIRWL